ncbi:O-antigen ligase family protein [Leptolyngbya sp. DQ-M1]|uniref:O-antigen ligase family protein n=1 Tax=Leptolyngbya sp. DQ-M1 TaxID=2933920 RepID=UPI00329691EE
MKTQRLQSHPDPALQKHWTVVQVGLLLLPFSVFLGGIPVLLVALDIWRRLFSRMSREPVNRGLAVLSVLMIGAATFAVDRPTAFLGLFNFLPFFVVFAGLGELIASPQQLRQIAWIWVLTSIPVTLIGLMQLFFQVGGSPSLLWGLIEWTIAPGGEPLGRMSSVFTYANVLASYYAIVFILGLGVWLEERKPILGVILCLNMIGLILTHSRNAWAIAVLACLAFALYQGWKTIVALVGAVTGLMLGAAFAPEPIVLPLRTIVPRFFWARLNDQMYSDRPVNQLRSTQWEFAWSMTEQRPLTGWGLRSFSKLYTEQMHLWLGHPHNLFLMMAAETGLPAALLLYSLVSWILAQGVLQWRKLHKLDQRIYFTFWIAFLACTLFNFLDVPLFDARINLMGWVLLAGIWKTKAVS